MEKSKKKFIKLPGLGGGKELLTGFIRENLRYPKEAMEKGIEGDVIVDYKVNGKGEVTDAKIVHSLGYGCDEEALRLVYMLNYQEVKNKGIKVTTNNKIKIPFRLKRKPKPSKIRINYAPKAKPSLTGSNAQTGGKTYTYTYTLGESNS